MIAKTAVPAKIKGDTMAPNTARTPAPTKEPIAAVGFDSVPEISGRALVASNWRSALSILLILACSPEA